MFAGRKFTIYLPVAEKQCTQSRSVGAKGITAVSKLPFDPLSTASRLCLRVCKQLAHAWLIQSGRTHICSAVCWRVCFLPELITGATAVAPPQPLAACPTDCHPQVAACRIYGVAARLTSMIHRAIRY
eukprot:4940785-Pleurochrysis_carterae.AAC.1